MKSVFTEEYENILLILIEARKNASLTQQHVANKLERPQSFVSKYERGERRLDIIEFVAIARIIGLSASQIVADLESQLQIDSWGAK